MTMECMDTSDSASRRREQPQSNTRRKSLRQAALSHLPWLVLVVVLAIVGAALGLSAGFRATAYEAWSAVSSGDQVRIREYLSGYGAWGPVASVMLMVLQGIFAPIPASVVQLANGVVYGLVGGALLNLIGQMAGATVAFSISRVFGRSAVERFAGPVDNNEVIKRWLDRWGDKALFLIRAIPGMPSDFTSYLLGLTHMPAKRYLLVSFIGYIPQSLAYAWLGDAATDWFWWIVLAGFGVSLVIGTVVWAVGRFSRHDAVPALPIETGK